MQEVSLLTVSLNPGAFEAQIHYVSRPVTKGQRLQPGGAVIKVVDAAIDRISDTQTAARTQAEKFTLGEPGVALNDVMTDMQKASVSMQMGIQVRNKLVAAYQEVMSMQV